MASRSSTLLILLLSSIMVMSVVTVRGGNEYEYEYDDSLSLSYYHGTCQNVEKIIHDTMEKWIEKDPTLAPAIIRLHFHDCSVRGCDASILLTRDGSERWSNSSRSLRGFEVINDIKSELEKSCPKTVSCADILTAAARDATVAAGGPFWMVPYGRKDGRVSRSAEAESVPMGHESITQLIEFYQSMGLNILDLAVLSGAHTIGRSTCGALQYRLYDYEGTGRPDPSIDPTYLNFLRRKCRWASEYVDLDAVSPKGFDVQYYKNLEGRMGLLSTDQMLYSDPRTAGFVSAFSTQEEIFHHQFAASMVKLGNVQDYFGDEEGEIREDCRWVNGVK